MKPLPQLRLMPRVPKDLQRCLGFVAQYASGRPNDRERDIFTGIWKILLNPECNPVRSRRRTSGLEYRRQNAAQFVIVYVYMRPGTLSPRGTVSIRAIRHGSERDVFWGVRERAIVYGGSPSVYAAM